MELPMIDTVGAELVEVQFNEATGVLWVNVDGVCRLRSQRHKRLVVTENEMELYRQDDTKHGELAVPSITRGSLLSGFDSRLSNLKYALEHRETWPEGFTWNWMRTSDDCGCALALARRLWGEGGHLGRGEICGGHHDLYPIFFGPYSPHPEPETVAARIGEYLETHPDIYLTSTSAA